MTQLFDELFQQPQALRNMVGYYSKSSVLEEVACRAEGKRWIITGMGASFHAASICAYHLLSMGIDAVAIEAVDLLQYHTSLCNRNNFIVYVSQSGASGEVQPLLDLVPPEVDLVGITNHPDSPLGKNSRWSLPLEAGHESLIASKTYVNTLALLWILSRKSARKEDGSESSILLSVAARMESMLELHTQIKALWMDTLGGCEPLIFLGQGFHGITARQSAMMLSEWPKMPVLHSGIGAFRHGFIETAKPGMGAVIFASPGKTSASAHDLAQELTGYGVKTLMVENGSSNKTDADQPVDAFLGPILDVIPVQIFADEMAVKLNIPSGFRHLSKVVTKL